MTSQLEKLITDILCFTELATPDPAVKWGDTLEPHEVKVGIRHIVKQHIFDLPYIGPVEPLIDPWWGDMGVFMDATPRDVDGKWDISTIQLPEKSWGESALFQLTRCRRVPLKELRGHKILSEYVSEVSAAVIKRDGTYESARFKTYFIGRDSKGFGRWAQPSCYSMLLKRDAENGDIAVGGWTVEENEETTSLMNATIGMQFTRDYQWMTTIAVRNIGNPVLLTTDSAGARDMFSDREANGNRRSALKHWVEQHWRKCRKDADMESFVRQHLRGAEPFIWKGFNCRLTPSPYDIRLCARLEEERKVMKHEGRTMRLRTANAAMV